jgi:general secretion pathway protein J
MKLSSRGFTLIEVLLAILIGGLVLSSVYGIFSSVSNVSQRLAKEGEQYHKVRILFDRIGGELGSLRLDRIGNEAVFVSGTTVEGAQFLEFNTELVSPWFERYGGISRVRYELREEDGTATLYRSEHLLLADLAVEEALPFIGGLTNFKIRYYRQGNWQDQWLGQSPPQMVEIFFELDSDGYAIPFRSSFILPGVDG